MSLETPVRITRVQTFPLYLSKEEANNSYAGDTAVDHRGYVIRPPGGACTPRLRDPAREDRDRRRSGRLGRGTGAGRPVVAAAIVDNLLTPLIIGEDPRSVRTLWHRMTESMRERGHLTGHQADAMAAVDIALWDLWGHATGLSVSELAGGRFHEVLPTYVSGSAASMTSSARRRRPSSSRAVYAASSCTSASTSAPTSPPTTLSAASTPTSTSRSTRTGRTGSARRGHSVGSSTTGRPGSSRHRWLPKTWRPP